MFIDALICGPIKTKANANTEMRPNRLVLLFVEAFDADVIYRASCF
jgi:hypothetical protein